jgi:hypothetical protein
MASQHNLVAKTLEEIDHNNIGRVSTVSKENIKSSCDITAIMKGLGTVNFEYKFSVQFIVWYIVQIYDIFF